MGRQEDIHSLIEANRYSSDIIPELEKYVHEQVAGRHYDLEANLALLKLYQFYPDKASVPVISHILIKAIMNLPQPDLILSLYLISEKIVSFAFFHIPLGFLLFTSAYQY
jgi:translation initiation factor 3 subunit K